jgi:release factor glutamine methyltransferase
MIKMNRAQPPSFHYQDLHITLDTHVYNPAEDTFLLLETIQYTPQDKILEIGTGCGIISLVCSYNGAAVIATDINPYALHLSQKNIKHNQQILKGEIHLVQGNLFTMIQQDVLFDIIIFNPPYLPTTTKQQLPGWINMAYDGGKTGTKVIDEFLQHLSQHLKPTGKAYFVGSSLQKTGHFKEILQNNLVTCRIIKEQTIGDEKIQVYQIAY